MRILTILAAACLLLVSCQQEEGCTDPAATNYDPNAVEDDGSCDYENDPSNPGGGGSLDEPTIDGYTYEVVAIGEQVWFAENLRTTVYANGDPIPFSLTNDEWDSTNEGATSVYGEMDGYCYEDSPALDACDPEQSLDAYGRLYNWYAVNDQRGICPNGWHTPTDEEWKTLEVELGMNSSEADATGERGSNQGDQLKSISGWYDNGNGTDDFGFSALPGGYLSGGGLVYDQAGQFGYWWSSSSFNSEAWNRSLRRHNSLVGRLSVNPNYGLSVRCIQD